MVAYYIVFGIVLCGLCLPLVRDDQVRRPFLWTYLAMVILLLVFFAGLRSPHVDRDYPSYFNWFSEIHTGSVDPQDRLKDPAFAAIAFVVTSIGLSYLPIPMFYAFLALIAKTVLTFRITAERTVTIYFYLIFCRFFVLSEMTQIRVAVAIPLMSLAIYLACMRKPARAILLYLLALAFHLSIAIGIPLFILVLCGVGFQSRISVLLFAPMAVVVKLMFSSLLQQLSAVYRVSKYLQGQEAGYELSLASLHFFLHVSIILLLVIFFWRHLSLFERVAVVYSAFAMFLYSVFISDTVLASRSEEIFDLFWLFLLVVIFNRIPSRWHLAYLTIIGLLGYEFFQSTIGIIQPYALWDAPY